MRYNAADQKGVLLGERLASAIGDYAETIVFGRLAGRGIDPALLRPVVIEIEPTGPLWRHCQPRQHFADVVSDMGGRRRTCGR